MSREKDRRTPLPQLVVTHQGYRMFDPEMVRDRKDLTETAIRSELRYDGFRREFPIAVTFALLGGLALPVLLGSSVLRYVLWLLAGLVGGLLVGGGVMGIVTPDREKEYRDDHRGARLWAEIAADDRRAAVCSVAEDVASTRAWQDKLIDTDRHLATIVWSGVSKDATQATEEDDADVEAVTANLRELLAVARDLDHRREYGTPAVDDRISAREPTARARALSSEILENGRTVRDLS